MDKGRSYIQSAPEVRETCHRELRHFVNLLSYPGVFEPLGAMGGKAGRVGTKTHGTSTNARAK